MHARGWLTYIILLVTHATHGTHEETEAQKGFAGYAVHQRQMGLEVKAVWCLTV